MIKSAGLLIIQEGKILLGHPTNAPWQHRHSISKGKIEEGEDILTAALRETKEEFGLEIDPQNIEQDQVHCIDYTDKKGKIYKKVYYYLTRTQDLPEVLPSENLQTEEMDWAGFLTKEEAQEKIFWRFKEMLNFI